MLLLCPEALYLNQQNYMQNQNDYKPHQSKQFFPHCFLRLSCLLCWFDSFWGYASGLHFRHYFFVLSLFFFLSISFSNLQQCLNLYQNPINNKLTPRPELHVVKCIGRVCWQTCHGRLSEVMSYPCTEPGQLFLNALHSRGIVTESSKIKAVSICSKFGRLLLTNVAIFQEPSFENHSYVLVTGLVALLKLIVSKNFINARIACQ